jgi:hypothetical protein
MRTAEYRSERKERVERERKMEKRQRLGGFFRKAAIVAAIVLVVKAVGMGGAVIERANIEQEGRTEAVAVKHMVENGSFTINGGSNLRREPRVDNDKYSASNRLGTVGQSDGATYEVKVKDGETVDVVDNDYDVDGRWLGLEKKDLKEAPEYIYKALEKDKTGKVWVNINQNVNGLNLGDRVEDDK